MSNAEHITMTMLSPGTTPYKAFYALVEEQLAEGREVTLSMGGRSMRPTLSASDSIVLRLSTHQLVALRHWIVFPISVEHLIPVEGC